MDVPPLTQAQSERLEISVLEARGLCQGDAPPDAYVTLRTAIGKQKTRVRRDTFFPKWRIQSHVIHPAFFVLFGRRGRYMVAMMLV